MEVGYSLWKICPRCSPECYGQKRTHAIPNNTQCKQYPSFLKHSNRNVIKPTKLSTQDAPWIVKMISSSDASNKKTVNFTFWFQCIMGYRLTAALCCMNVAIHRQLSCYLLCCGWKWPLHHLVSMRTSVKRCQIQINAACCSVSPRILYC